MKNKFRVWNCRLEPDGTYTVRDGKKILAVVFRESDAQLMASAARMQTTLWIMADWLRCGGHIETLERHVFGIWQDVAEMAGMELDREEHHV